MVDLTVVILTKNEEKNLRKCIESFRGIVKRFVIVDSFSTDGTEKLCYELDKELKEIGSSLDFYQNKWVSYADGIVKRFVIVDSFSTDGTEKLCYELDKELKEIGSSLDFYQNKWVSYAEQLNWGLKNTNISTEWSMRMDADEEMMEDLIIEIDKKLSEIKEPVNGVILHRRVYFMGKWIKHGGRYPERLLRIFRTGKAMCEMKIMDEHMIRQCAK